MESHAPDCVGDVPFLSLVRSVLREFRFITGPHWSLAGSVGMNGHMAGGPHMGS